MTFLSVPFHLLTLRFQELFPNCSALRLSFRGCSAPAKQNTQRRTLTSTEGFQG